MDIKAREVVFPMKIINLDAEMCAKRAIVALVCEINGGGIHMVMVLMNQDTIVPFQIVVLTS